jgi:hypothetical protein
MDWENGDWKITDITNIYVRKGATFEVNSEGTLTSVANSTVYNQGGTIAKDRKPVLTKLGSMKIVNQLGGNVSVTPAPDVGTLEVASLEQDDSSSSTTVGSTGTLTIDGALTVNAGSVSIAGGGVLNGDGSSVVLNGDGSSVLAAGTVRSPITER